MSSTVLSPTGLGVLGRVVVRRQTLFLGTFLAVVVAHWAEHLTQAFQIYALGWPPPKAGGVLGLYFPVLVRTELLHYGYALFMLVGLWVLRLCFTGRGRQWWMLALAIQFWHHIEHLLLFAQATLDRNLGGGPVPMSVVQFFVPRVELHLFYNAAVTIPMVVAMVLRARSNARPAPAAAFK